MPCSELSVVSLSGEAITKKKKKKTETNFENFRREHQVLELHRF
jgi:hypothetical protein